MATCAQRSPRPCGVGVPVKITLRLNCLKCFLSALNRFVDASLNLDDSSITRLSKFSINPAGWSHSHATFSRLIT